MRVRLIWEACFWLLVWAAVVVFAHGIEAAVDCVSGCNEIRAHHHQPLKEMDWYCIMWSNPQGYMHSQVQENKGGQPIGDGTLTNSKFNCGQTCTEACNPPYAKGREMEPPTSEEDKKRCQQIGEEEQKRKCGEVGSGS